MAFSPVPFAIATNNGTAALHACLMVAGVVEGDEVLPIDEMAEHIHTLAEGMDFTKQAGNG